MEETKKVAKLNRQDRYALSLFIAATICMAVIFIYVMISRYANIPFKLGFGTCILHDYMHIYCPGCGGTRAVKELLSFHIVKSFLSNPTVIYIAGVILYYYVGELLTIISGHKKHFYRMHTWMLVGILVVAISNMVVRNALMIGWGIDYLQDLNGFW